MAVAFLPFVISFCFENKVVSSISVELIPKIKNDDSFLISWNSLILLQIRQGTISDVLNQQFFKLRFYGDSNFYGIRVACNLQTQKGNTDVKLEHFRILKDFSGGNGDVLKAVQTVWMQWI